VWSFTGDREIPLRQPDTTQQSIGHWQPVGPEVGRGNTEDGHRNYCDHGRRIEVDNKTSSGQQLDAEA
jgi:hypothetical protein